MLQQFWKSLRTGETPEGRDPSVSPLSLWLVDVLQVLVQMTIVILDTNLNTYRFQTSPITSIKLWLISFNVKVKNFSGIRGYPSCIKNFQSHFINKIIKPWMEFKDECTLRDLYENKTKQKCLLTLTEINSLCRKYSLIISFY